MKRARSASRASGPLPSSALAAASTGLGQRDGLGDEERAQLDRREPCGAQVGEHVVDAVLPWVQVEHELRGRVLVRVGEEGAAVARVVDRAEDRRRGDRARRDVVVEVALVDGSGFTESRARRADHLRGRVDPAIAEAAREQRLTQAAVPAGEVEHLVAGREGRPERDDQVGAMGEVRRDVRVGALRPVRRLARVLTALVAHSARSRSGCLRTKRAIPRACQSV